MQYLIHDILRRSNVTSWLFTVGVAVCAVLAGDRAIRSANYGPASSAASTGRNTFFFGVMGEVTRPGVYAGSTQFPRLGAVLQSAGGVTPDATGTLRVVRRGRTVLITSTFAGNANALVPGDLVIAESRLQNLRGTRYQGSDGQGGRHSAALRHGVRPSVQLAFVNLLLDRPIVVKVQGDRATLRQIVSDLRQSEDVVSSIRVIGPPRPGAQQPDADTDLVAGSVLVFEPNTIDFSRMPRFPQPYALAGPVRTPPPVISAPPIKALPQRTRAPFSLNPVQPLKPATVDPPAMIAVAPSGPLTPPGGVQRAAPPNSAAHQTPTPPASDAETLTSQHPDPIDVSGDAPKKRESEPSRTPDANARSLGNDSATAGVTGHGGSGSERPTLDVAPTLQPRPTPQTAMNPRAVADTPQTTESSRSGGTTVRWSLLCVGGIGAVAFLAAFAILWSMARDAEAESKAAGRMGSRSALDALLHREWPVVEEPLALPDRLQLHGRPRPTQVVRVDAAHASRGTKQEPVRPRPSHTPHFAATSRDKSTADRSADRSEDGQPRTPHAIPLGASAVERALLTVGRESRS